MVSQERRWPSIVIGTTITFAQNKPDKPVKVDDVFTNAYNSKIMPAK
ncbi:MAG: hypothetical protein AABM33_08430 [Pseudomonadota bacterium]